MLSKGHAKACSSACILEAFIDHGIDETIFVDTASFLAIIDSLPDKQDVVFGLAENTLTWKCGPAKGKIATLVVEGMPEIKRSKKNKGWCPTCEFVDALALGGLSCGTIAATSTGMYGVVIDSIDDLCIYASDDTTISACFCPNAKDTGLNAMVVITPESADLLSSLMDTKEGILICEDTELLYSDKYCRLMVKMLPKLSKDIGSVIGNFMGSELTVKIDRERIGVFIKRATALAEQKKQSYISLGVSEERLTLSFDEGTASSDEWYLVEELAGVADLPPVKVDALKMARALKQSNAVVLDHVERGLIVLRGYDPEFYYFIAGRR